jgi:hypothetical protein
VVTNGDPRNSHALCGNSWTSVAFVSRESNSQASGQTMNTVGAAGVYT